MRRRRRRSRSEGNGRGNEGLVKIREMRGKFCAREGKREILRVGEREVE